jgi:curli biogenesis system outer membrane secretion channel CsgG
MLKKLSAILVLSLAMLTLASLTLTAQSSKPSIYVEPFDYSTVMTSIQAVFGTQVNIGQGIRAMMVKRVSDGGAFTPVERAKMDNLLKEQDFGASGRVKQGTQAKIGNIRGAQWAIMGDIVVFGRDDRKVGGGLAGFGGGLFGRAAGALKTDKAVVVLNYRLVNVETSEILTTGEAKGESKRNSANLGAMLGGWRGGGGGNFDMTSSNFAETIIGEATTAAVDMLAADLNAKAPGLISSMPAAAIEARVAVANGNSLTISAGSTSGVAVGDSFQVLKVGAEIKDPVTGEVLDVEVTPLGTLVITTVRDRVSTGTYTGQPGVAVGDMVKK